MLHLATLAALALSASALVIPRATPPAGWETAILEPYDTYHTRYLALSCNTKHSTAFFDQCCHPLLANEKLETRPAQCNPETDSADDDDDNLPFCDDDDDGDDDATPVAVAPSPAVTTHPAAATTPAPAPKPAAPSPKPVAQTQPAAAPPTTVSSASVQKGGVATFFYQNGVAGACGTVHPDSAMIAAIDADRYGDLGKKSSLCGKQVKLTNTKNNKSVTVTIADACPTCLNTNSIDLSVGAFTQIATEEEGEVPITWSFL